MPIDEGRATVMFYIFIIAMLNLGLGFAAAMQLGRRYNCLAVMSPSFDSTAATARADGHVEDTADNPLDGNSEHGVAADSSEQPRETVPHELESDLDKLFENLDI